MVSTASKPRKIAALEDMARTMVGDGGSPNLFFVTDRGVVVSVSRSFDVAYAHWQDLESLKGECALEDRQTGVLASRSPDEERGPGLFTCDDTWMLRNK